MATPKEISIIKDLSILEIINQAGSYTKAADKLGIQQPNLSTKVQNLEKELKVKLFSKSSKGVTATHECLDMINFSKRIYDKFF